MRNVMIAVGALCGALAYAPSTSADTAAIDAVTDNTLCEDVLGATSNGAGQSFFVGRTNDGLLRRGLLKFDVAAAVPAGSTIDAVTLTLNMSKTRGPVTPVTLHRVLADWGEGTSDAGGQEGGCAPSATGDATWIHAKFTTDSWTAAGGDFSPAASNSLAVSAAGSYTWTSTAAAVANVQAWLDAPATNFGWLMIGDEVNDRNSKRFDSRSHPTSAGRPLLVVDYTLGVSGPDLYQSPSPDPLVLIQPANSIYTGASPHSFGPAPDPLLFYIVDDGSGTGSPAGPLLMVKVGVGIDCRW